MTATPLSLSADVIMRAVGSFAPTPRQRAVIEAPLEPALVIAGAGSGKTATMSARVLWLVANGHVRADQILGLTFTRKAAGELSERISARLADLDEFGRRGLLPHLPTIVETSEFTRIERAAPGPARDAVRRDVLDAFARDLGAESDERPLIDRLLDQVRVSTYNAFADAIVRENASRIGRDPDAAMLSSSAAWIIARHVAIHADDLRLDELDKGVDRIADAILSLSGDLLENRPVSNADGRTLADRVRGYASELSAALEPFADPLSARPAAWDRAYGSLTSLPRLLELVARYDGEKQRRGVLDFADQVAGALEVVERAPDVADEMRNQYRVVLLDEYQDTSVLQTRLLSTLFRDEAVMAVGDPNQAIYTWRGASADGIHSFPRAFTHERVCHRFSLMTSWRNEQVVLNAANRLVRPLAGSRDGVEPLAARDGAGDGRLDIEFAHTVDDEAHHVAEWFGDRIAEHDAAEHADRHSGAILFRQKKHMRRFADALADRGIPHRILGLGGLLDVPEVTDVVCALRVIDDPGAGSALIRLLVGPRFAVGVADMAALYDLASRLAEQDASGARLSEEVRQRVRASAGIDEQVSIIDGLDAIRTRRRGNRLFAGFSEQGLVRLTEAAELFDRLRAAATGPIPDLIRMIEQELRLDIELAANETRGEARTAGAQLRAFTEEVRAFLSVDDRATIGSVLAWLDYAERADDLMPRTEPAEPGVVQLLTIHGSKGLEWDSVVVARVVDGELPAGARDVSGGFAFGRLPYVFRGDAAALPRFSWHAPDVVPADAAALRAAKRDLKNAFEAFADANRAYQAEEERRLAYVAVTRARANLLLTGSRWSGQKRPKQPSPFLAEVLDELGREPLAQADDDENPYDGAGATLAWPVDALGARRQRVAAAAERVTSAGAAEPTAELARLLAEREATSRRTRTAIPTRVPASKFKDYVVDFDAALTEIERPMPERPFRQTRLGTLFHQWVEQRSGLIGATPTPDDALWEIDDDEYGTAFGASAEDERDLARLREIFERSEWAPLQPIEVETEVDFALALDDGAPPHIMICKLDAVYRRDDRGGRIEIVDWKTGKAPTDRRQRDERMLQLALYRLAYHRRHGVPLDEIDVALYYVSDDLVIRDESPLTEHELIDRWRASRR